MLSIKWRQQNLQWLGFYFGKVDGRWGNASKTATKNFQAFVGITRDAIYGKNTDVKLIAEVKKYQKKLGIKADGKAGAKTFAKTKTYQKSKGIVADGICGTVTRNKLNGKKTSKTTVTYETPVNWNSIKYFKKNELDCGCGGKYCDGFPVPMKQKCMNVADRARAYFGKPATVSSGVRCAAHNKNVGGVPASQHMKGKAMDFSISGVSGSKLCAYLKKQPEVKYTYVITGNWVHFNTY